MGAAVLLVLLLLAAKHTPGVPAVPAGAQVTVFPNPASGTGVATLRRTTWHVNADASGQRAGQMVLVQNAAAASDWVLVFRPDAGGSGILAQSGTPGAAAIVKALASGE